MYFGRSERKNGSVQEYVGSTTRTVTIREKEHKLATDENLNEFEKELLEVEILEIKVNMNNIQNSITGAVRKMSFFTTQYKSILEKLAACRGGKDEHGNALYYACGHLRSLAYIPVFCRIYMYTLTYILDSRCAL